MTLLGFDTSTAATSAAVLCDDGQGHEVLPPVTRLEERPGHASELMPAVREVMERAGVRFSDLDAIAVGLGPGTFTGLRIGVATARALAKSAGLPVRGVSSLAALAEPLGERYRLPLIDAKRGEVYGALYEGDSPVWEPFVAAPDELVQRLATAPATPLAAGDGSLRFRDQLEAAGVTVAPAESGLHVVSALSLCRVALGVPDASPEQTLPDYLRAPDAIAR